MQEQEQTYYLDRSLVIWEIGKTLINLGVNCPIISGHKMIDLKTLKYAIFQAIYGIDIHTDINSRPETKSRLSGNSSKYKHIGKMNLVSVDGENVRYVESDESEMFDDGAKRSKEIDKAILNDDLDVNVIKAFDGDFRLEYLCNGEVICDRYCCDAGCQKKSSCETYAFFDDFCKEIYG